MGSGKAQMTKKVRRVELMLDSGAFNAWNRGEEIDVNDYIKYVHTIKHCVSSYVNLDVIPGAPGRRRTLSEIEYSAAKSHEHQLAMRAAGLSPIPVFHQGESFKWLEKMLDDGEPYIGIGVMKDLWWDSHRPWLDEVFSLLTTKEGRPLVRVHGFGTMNPMGLWRYPFYSVDSTSWALAPAYGLVFIPTYVNGEPDYRQMPKSISVTGRTRATPRKLQFQDLGPLSQESVMRFLTKAGVTMTEARNSPYARQTVMLLYYKELCSQLTDIRFEHHNDGGFLSVHSIRIPKGLTALGPWTMQFICATSLTGPHNLILNKCDIGRRLLSFYDLRKETPEFLEYYINTGLPEGWQRTDPKQAWHRETYLSFRRMSLYEHIKRYSDEAAQEGSA